jgi:hypothetical protein
MLDEIHALLQELPITPQSFFLGVILTTIFFLTPIHNIHIIRHIHQTSVFFFFFFGGEISSFFDKEIQNILDLFPLV